MELRGANGQSNERVTLYNKDRYNELVRKLDEIIRDATRNKEEVIEYMKFADKVDFGIGNSEKDGSL